MASYTSTQSGDFDDASTWGGGGYPNTNADTFTITNGHTVTYNISGTITDGYGNSNIYGHLKHDTGVTELKMNGNLDVRTNGLYEMVDDSTLIFKGTNADDHGLNIKAEVGASFLATGSAPTQETKLAASGDVGDAYFNVDSATNFQTGDWCSIHYRYWDLKSREAWIANTGYPTGPLSGDGVNQSRSSWEAGDQNHNEPAHSLDEGFIIHDISAAYIYPRNLIGPEATITSAKSASIKVSDSRVFRVGQTVIFGNASTRSVLEISNINNNRNLISFGSSLTSTDVVGQTVYLGGAVNHHYAKSTVRRVGSMVAAKAAKDATSITINEASDFAIGDEFYADHVKTDDETWDELLPNNGDTWKLDTNKRHLISNKSGNTLTFSPALPHVVAAGSFIYKANRKITIRGADYSVDKPYVYFQNKTTGATIDGQNRYDRKLLINNMQFLGLGNSSSSFQLWFRGGYNDGYWRYSHSVEGVVADGMGNTECNYIRADSYVHGIWRNWIIANHYRGGYSGNVNNQIFNTIYLNCRRSNENRYIYYQNGRYWFNRCVRIYDYDYVRAPSLFALNPTQYQNYYCGENGIYLHNGQYHFQSHFIARYRPIRGWKETMRQVKYCKLENINQGTYDYLYFENGHEMYRYDPLATNQIVLEKDYILGNDWIYAGGVAKTWDEQEGAYRVYGPLSSNYHEPAGSWQEIEVPPKSTVRVTAQAKLPATTYNDNTSWTYCPHLIYYFLNSRLHHDDAFSANYYNSDFFSDKRDKSLLTMEPELDVNFGIQGRFNYDDASQTGSYQNTPFTSKTQYNSKTITVTNTAWFSKTLRVGLCGISNNARMGWYEKPLKIAVTKEGGLGIRDTNAIKKVGQFIFKIGVSTVNNIKRIGGSRF